MPKLFFLPSILLALPLVLIPSIAGLTHSPPEVSSEEVDKKLHNCCLYPTVRIVCPKDNSCGTGFIVRSDKFNGKFRNVVVTASHNLDHDAPMFVQIAKYKNWSEFEGYDTYPMIVYARSEDKDLAIVLFESDKNVNVAEMDFEPKLFIGTQVVKVGYGLREEARVDHGRLTSLKMAGPAFFKDHLRTDAYTIFGDSGGPLFQVKTHRVIGVMRAIRCLNNGQVLPNHSFAVPLRELKTWSESPNNDLRFVYTSTERMPVLAFIELQLSQYEVVEEKK